MKIEVFWNDLTKEKQEKIQKLLNLKDNNNWDVNPITIIEIEMKEVEK